MARIVHLSWDEIKAIIDDSSIDTNPTYVETSESYIIFSNSGAIIHEAIIPNPFADFENNYQDTIITTQVAPVQIQIRSIDPNTIADVTSANRLKVDAVLGDDVTLSQGCPVTSKKFRMDHSETPVTIPAAYTTIFSHSGSGKLFGFIADFNSDSIRVRLTIDSSDVVFELTLSQVEDLKSAGTICDEDDGAADLLGGFINKTRGNKLNVNFPCPIAFSSEVKIEAQRTGSTDKTLERRLVFISKET